MTAKRDGKTYRVGDLLGSAFEIYVIDGLSDAEQFDGEEGPSLARAREAVVQHWKGGRIFVPNDLASDLASAMSYVSNSLDGEIGGRHVDSIGIAKRQQKCVDNFCWSLSRQVSAAQVGAP